MNPEKMNWIIKENLKILDFGVFNSEYLDTVPQALFINGVDVVNFTWPNVKLKVKKNG